MVAKVLLNISASKLNRVYDYLIKDEMLANIKIGMRVKVSFGRGKDRFEEGIVVKLEEESLSKFKLKYIEELLDEYSYIDDNKLKLAKWMSYMYFCNVYDALKLMLPPGSNNINNSKELNAKTQKVVSLLKDEFDINNDIENEVIKSAKQQRVLSFLLDNNDYITLSDLMNILNISRDIIKRLETNGYLEITEMEIKEDKLETLNIQRTSKLIATDEQKQVIDGLVKQYNDIQSGKETVNKSLLFGVTGSGKTEVYLQLIEEVLKDDKTVILLVPEISLTHQTLTRFLARFGNQISLLHSQMTISKRKEEYRKIKTGESKIVIGARSAIFAPLENVGLIIIDEEHDTSYYSMSQSPRYSAKEVAAYIASLNNAMLLLGSATPEVTSYYKAVEENKMKLFTLKNRPKNATLPEVIMVDKKLDRLNNPNSILSSKLKEEILINMINKEQTMIFINKRGYSSYLTCNNCSHTVVCENCDIAMTYHKKSNLCLCHYCNNVKTAVTKCPTCLSDDIRESSFGTEKIEEELKNNFNNISILRMDRDTTMKKDSHTKILEKFKNENVDILVGTQMISKGHDIENVTLVGVLGVDSMLNMNDYLGRERAYSNISQVSGRAGRGDKEGRVVIETEDLTNETLAYATSHDYESFYESEIAFRRALSYPPFTQLVVLTITGKTESLVKSESTKLYNILNNIKDKPYTIYSPKAPFAYKINNKYKINILIKCNLNSAVLKALHLGIDNYEKNKHRAAGISVTRNPISM